MKTVIELQLLIEKNKYLKEIIKSIYVPTIGKYKKYKQNKLFIKEGRNALYQIDKVFKELEVDFWLEFGTLLGAIREKSFIAHDLDIDIGMFMEDFDEKNEKIFNKYGFKKVKMFLVDNGEYAREETYEYKGVGIDIFYFHRRDNEILTHTFAPEKGKSRYKTIEEKGGLLVRELRYPYSGFMHIEFLGKKFLAPSNLHEHLTASYGENYMIKDPNYSNEIATNVRIIPDKIGVRKIYD